MNIIRLDQIDSTNSFIKTLSNAESGTVVVCCNQTAGRGQRGNSWEAEPGKNLTFSILLRPQNIKAAMQFAISRAVALAIVDCLEHWMHRPGELSVKWPNDIYYGNLKLAGILIENVLSADNIERSIAGVGINVNQIKFLSDAPNPVSMAQITNMSYDLDTLLEDVCSTILSSFNAEDASVGVASEKEYAERLWRNDGYYPYESEGEQFEAKIVNVAHNGMLTLERRDGVRCEYAFKEVAFVL